MSLEAIGVLVAALAFLGTAGGWIWKLRGELDKAKTEPPKRPITQPPFEAPQFACMTPGQERKMDDLVKTVDSIEQRIQTIAEDVKEMKKWQIPGLEKELGALAKGTEKLAEVMEELAKEAARR